MVRRPGRKNRCEEEGCAGMGWHGTDPHAATPFSVSCYTMFVCAWNECCAPSLLPYMQSHWKVSRSTRLARSAESFGLSYRHPPPATLRRAQRTYLEVSILFVGTAVGFVIASLSITLITARLGRLKVGWCAERCPPRASVSLTRCLIPVHAARHRHVAGGVPHDHSHTSVPSRPGGLYVLR